MSKRKWAFIVAALLFAALACSSEDTVDKSGETHTNVELCGAVVLPAVVLAWRWLL